METPKPARIPSTLFQSHTATFGIAAITLHDATTSPVLSLVVDHISSGASVKFPTPDAIEYVQDPEDSRQQRNSPTLSPNAAPTSKELPSLLLKVEAREGLRLSFELTGDLLNSVQPRQGARTGTEEPNLDLDKPRQVLDHHQDQIAEAEDGDANKINIQNSAISEYHENAIDPSLLEPPNNGVTGLCATTPEETPTGRYAPTIYFAETQTEQSMHDLCCEAAFQQQLHENPGSVSIVRAAALSSEHNPKIQTYLWEWGYHTEDRSEQRSQSHKAVFGPITYKTRIYTQFMTRSHLTGALVVLATFSLWIQHGSDSTASSSVRLPSSLQHNSNNNSSAWNARHWRRTSTPEKNSNIGRLPSFWGKLPAFPPGHGSLPSIQQEAAAKADGERTVEAFVPIRISSPIPIPLANGTEDGPLFRATVVECEQNIRNMKSASKRILKAAQAVLEARKAWVMAEEAFTKELELMKSAESLIEKYWRPLSEHLAEQSEMLSQHMRDFLIEPFSQFYGIDIKTAELHRKAFEEESKEYYSFLSRYMGMKQENAQKKQEADAKHEKKRRAFELKRLEYWEFLIDMKAGGSKGDELCLQLTKYTEKHCEHVVEMGVIAKEHQLDLAAIATANKHRQERNIGLLPPSRPFARNTSGLVLTQSKTTSMSSNVSLDSPRTPYFDRESFDLQLEPEEVVPSTMYGASQTDNTSMQSITGIRDLEHQDIDAGLALGRRKEGFLFATSRPNNHNGTVLEKPNINWHKYWCVLSEGQLHEYSHWRKGVTQPHIDPINLRIATVRSCRNQDRRFCFEVITPKFRRVYQAINSEDMNSWISVISNAIQSLLNGTSSCRNLNLEYTSGVNYGYRTPGSPDGKGLMAGLGMSRPSMEQVLNATSLPTSLQDRVQPGQVFGRKRGGNAVDGLNELGQIIQPIAAQANLSNDPQNDPSQLGVKLLWQMREQHSANTVCADCGAKNPDWCVINLECSGIHRSLGTHISKVRSLNLDTTSYTKDLFEFIRSVGNNISNEVWEANLAQPKVLQQQGIDNQAPTTKVAFRKPVVNDSREYKVAFIRKKYADRAFVNRQLYSGTGDIVSRATEALFRAATANDIPAAITAFAAGANINTVQRADNENDAGPFIEQDFSPLPPPLERRNEDASDLGDVSNTLSSSIFDEGILQLSALDDSAASETSSQLSRSTMGSSPISTTDRSEETTSSDQRSAGNLEIRPRRLGGRPISSVMVLQTTPLLIALRHGVQFTLEEGVEVYPLAEFLMQNGAASNMNMEVKLMNGGPATGLMEPSGPTNLKKGPQQRVKPEEISEGMIERDASLLPSSSIGSRLHAGTSPTGQTAVSPSGVSLRSPDSNDGEVDKVANRRSVGQIVELRGEDGTNAMEYLRAKSIARGELVHIAPTSPPPVVYTSNISASGTVDSTSWQGGARLRPSSLKDMNIASMSTPSMSSALINKLTLSPRLRPSGSVAATSESTSASQVFSATNGAAGGGLIQQRDSRMLSANPLTSYPPPARYNNQDIATLFQNQKRRGSDGGTGSGLFSSMKASSFSLKDKEKAAAKAQARRSGDFSMFRPPSIMSSLSQQSDTSANTGGALNPSPAMEFGSFVFNEGDQLSSDVSKPNNGSKAIIGMDNMSNNNIGGAPSRTQKVKASFTKSIRMSAAYFRGSIIKDDGKAKSIISGKDEVQSRSSMSAARLDSDDEEDGGEGEELTMAELLALEEQQQQQEQQEEHQSDTQPPRLPLPPSSSTSRVPSKSFFSAMSFSSTPNLLQKQASSSVSS
ncbi:hypothetical protein BGX27_008622 [Mortierella sp. AM989]|nr:hypothetical protein BGX27_008622 [Mortierella sp. AM989]